MTSAFDQLIQGIRPLAVAAEALGQTPSPPVAPVVFDPSRLALALYDFQVEAVQHALRDAVTKPYGYIGLEMGLGKTPCGVAVADAVRQAGIGTVLIVVPPSMRVTWSRELFRFAPHLRNATIRSSKPDADDVIPDDVDVLIIGDASIAGWADFLTGKVGALIIDEAHRFKNKNARSAALRQIASGEKKVLIPGTKRKRTERMCLPEQTPRMRVLMSGTPTPNGRHQELATQIDVMGDDAWRDIGGQGMFWHHYVPHIDQYSRGNNDEAGLYRAMTESWYYRRLRSDVLDLPGKGRTALHLEATGRPVGQYKQCEHDLVEFLKGKNGGKDMTPGQRRAAALIKMLSLRKLAGECKTKAVVEHVKELLEEQPGGVFVVAENRSVMDDLLVGLAKYHPSTVQGGMSDNDKARNVDDFCSGKSRVLIGQITAAGVGLTLHGDGLNHRVVVAQLPWTPADLKQAEDRLDRIGQTNFVEVEVAICAIDGVWTIDERLWGMLESKNFASTTISDGEGEYLLSEVQDAILDSYRDQGRNR